MTSKLFTPTFLYIKQHSVTGLLYFGKTVCDPEKYLGSGTRWRNHLNKHGKEHVINLWYCLFTEKEEIVKFAKMFSINENIVLSDDWANLVEENGTGGGSERTMTHRERLSKSLVEWHATRKENGISYPKNRIYTNKRVYSTVECPHCFMTGSSNIMNRWHFDNCKNK